MGKCGKLRGGSATVHSMEYFGKPEAAYVDAAEPNTGKFVAVSHGVVRGDVAGPDLDVYPNSVDVKSCQNGGGSCGAIKMVVVIVVL